MHGRPVWLWSLETFLSIEEIGQVVLVGNHDNAHPRLRVCAGGNSRAESVSLGLRQVDPDTDWVLIHDGARPFVTEKLIRRMVSAAESSSAAYPGIPITDTIRREGGSGSETLDRTGVFAVQTPQAARYADLLRAYSASSTATDDVGVLAEVGVIASLVPGEWSNIKLTMPEDLERAAAILAGRETRTGFGYDIHRFSQDPGRKLMLGGVEFEDRPGLEGHSDADVLLHAVVDALLGAAGLGDIGQLYPNTDARWKNAASLVFLEETARRIRNCGWIIVNVDCSVIAERPKIMVRQAEIREAIANCAGIEVERVSVKATTNEGLGSLGRGEGIAAFATAQIQRPFVGR